MKRHSPVNVVFYFPATEPAKAELEQRVAQIHADAVSRRIGALHCAHQQKKALFDAVIEAAKKNTDNSEKLPCPTSTGYSVCTLQTEP